jgi:hypothetical protein
MTEDEKWDYINNLDEELLFGGVIISEWSTFIMRDADIAFCSGANLGAILASQAAIESHLRFEYFDSIETRNVSFFELIERARVPSDLKINLHRLRKYRNKWVHVNAPNEDSELLKRPEYYEKELEEMAIFSIRTLREVIYLDQFI